MKIGQQVTAVNYSIEYLTKEIRTLKLALKEAETIQLKNMFERRLRKLESDWEMFVRLSSEF